VIAAQHSQFLGTNPTRSFKTDRDDQFGFQEGIPDG
jgi:hypothetical protein